MRFSFAILAVLASTAAASGLYPRQIPNCATTCITGADLGGCSPTDNGCLCKNQAFVNSVTSCIVSTCQGADLQAAISGAQALCAAVGVTLTGSLPAPTSTGSSTNTATSPAATGTSTGTSTSTRTNTATTSAPATTTSNAAFTYGIHTLAGMAAFGLALAL